MVRYEDRSSITGAAWQLGKYGAVGYGALAVGARAQPWSYSMSGYANSRGLTGSKGWAVRNAARGLAGYGRVATNATAFAMGVRSNITGRAIVGGLPTPGGSRIPIQRMMALNQSRSKWAHRGYQFAANRPRFIAGTGKRIGAMLARGLRGAF